MLFLVLTKGDTMSLYNELPEDVEDDFDDEFDDELDDEFDDEESLDPWPCCGACEGDCDDPDCPNKEVDDYNDFGDEDY